MRRGDTPDVAAAEFCAAHNLPVRVLGELASRIRTALAEADAHADSSAWFNAAPEVDASARHGASRSPTRSERSVSACGDRLYRDGLARKRALDRAAAAAREAREQAELAQLRSGPAITAMARTLPRAEPAWQRLAALAPGPEREVELFRQRQAREEAELDECTFAPTVSARSAALMQTRNAAMRAAGACPDEACGATCRLRLHHPCCRSAGVSAHTTLYADAQRRAARAAEYAQWLPEEVTFTPAVHSDAGWRDGDDDPYAGDRSLPIEDRLWAAGARYEEHAAAAQDEARWRDPTTGRLLFVPATGRAPADGRRSVSEQRPVHAHLYELRTASDQRRAELEAAQKRQADAVLAGASQRSAALADARRRRRFSHVFHALDTRGAGVLDLWAAASDAAATLHPEIAADVELAARLASKPLVDENEFCALMDDAVRGSNTGPRGYLAASVAHSGGVDDDAPTFAPRLHEPTPELAQALARRRPAGEPLHASLSREAAEAEKRRQLAVAQREASELAACTFKPQLVSLPPHAPVDRGSTLRTTSRKAATNTLVHRFADLSFDVAAVVAPPVSADAEDRAYVDAAVAEALARVRARLALDQH